MLTQNKVMLVKIEGTYGTDPTPTTASNFLACHNITVNPQLTYNDTQATDGSLSPRAGTLGQKYVEITFDHELQMNGTTPPCDPLLLSCGFDDSDADGTYVPFTTYPASSSCTIWVYEEDIVWKITGCRGNVEWNFNAGENVILSFTMQGLYAKPTDDTFPTSWTDNGDEPVVAMNQSFDWDSSNHPVTQSLSFSLNNTMAQNATLDDAQSDGIDSIQITDRLPEGSFNPEVTAISSIDYQTPYEAVTQKAIDYVVSDSAGDTCTISLPKTEIMSYSTGDRDGTLIYDIPFRCVRNTGDDEISVVFA